MAIQLRDTPNGMGFAEEAPQQEAQAVPQNIPIPPHPAKGKYGPVINMVFGERVEEFAPPELAPLIQTITQEMRGKSGFVQLGNQTFYKNGSMIELVENPMAVPEEAKVLNLDKKA